MTNRFDLEQKILKTFDIISDLKIVQSYNGDDRLNAVILLWQLKLEDLWETFESYVESLESKK